MTFPFSVQYDRVLKTSINSDNREMVLQYIKKRILEDNADNVVVENMAVTYKGSTSNWRGSLFGGVDDGKFYLVYKNNTWFLYYLINMSELFIVTSIMSAFMELFSLAGGGPWWIGIVAFSWLGGVNWIVSFLRHGGVVTSVAAGIDEMTYGKIELPESDKMTGELKSWF